MPILTSLKPDDNAFVAKAISENALNPNPVSGFHAEPDYWMETERWKRVVERYEWGAVLFISDRERKQHATIVAIGRVDVAKGKVSTQGGWNDIQFGWYHEMAMEFTAMMSKKGVHRVLQVPSCLGYRQPDVICDGGRNASNKMEPPCAWRDRCMAVQFWCVDNNQLQETVLKGKSPEQIVQLTTRLLERAHPPGRSSPRTTPKTAQAHEPVPAEERPAEAVEESAESAESAAPVQSSQPVVPRGKARIEPEQTQAVLDLVASVMTDVAAATGINVSADWTKAAASLGDIYLVDRTANSDYVSIYRKAKPKPLALASFRIRTRIGYLVQLPLPTTSPLLSGIVQSDVRKWNDGSFQSVVYGVQTEGDRLDHVKSIIASLITEQINGES